MRLQNFCPEFECPWKTIHFFQWNMPELNAISVKQWGISLVRINLFIRYTSLRLPELDYLIFLITNEEKNFQTIEATLALWIFCIREKRGYIKYNGKFYEPLKTICIRVWILQNLYYTLGKICCITYYIMAFLSA